MTRDHPARTARPCNSRSSFSWPAPAAWTGWLTRAAVARAAAARNRIRSADTASTFQAQGHLRRTTKIRGTTPTQQFVRHPFPNQMASTKPLSLRWLPTSIGARHSVHGRARCAVTAHYFRICWTGGSVPGEEVFAGARRVNGHHGEDDRGGGRQEPWRFRHRGDASGVQQHHSPARRGFGKTQAHEGESGLRENIGRK